MHTLLIMKIAKIVMQIGIIILLFLGVYSYVTKRSDLIIAKKIKYSPEKEMVRGRGVVILLSILAGLIIWALEVLIK